MLSGYFYAFVSLIVISIVANIIRKVLKTDNVILHALSFVPITCSFISLIWVITSIIGFIVLLICAYEITWLKDMLELFVIPILIVFTLLNFIACVIILQKFIRRNLIPNIYTSYIFTFLGCGVFGILTSIFFFFNAPWHSLDVDEYFAYESQRLPAFTSEYNLRLRFNSGEIINLHLDCCGQSDYILYKLKNGDFYMEAYNGRQPSYVVSPENKNVYFVSENNQYLYQLNGEAISGYGNGNRGNETFSTYRGDLGIDKGLFSVKGIETKDILENKTQLGLLTVYSFIKDFELEKEQKEQKKLKK